MTRKHYVMIAQAFADAMLFEDLLAPEAEMKARKEGVDTAACMVANALAKDNPRFDRERFLKACGVRAEA